MSLIQSRDLIQMALGLRSSVCSASAWTSGHNGLLTNGHRLKAKWQRADPGSPGKWLYDRV